MKSANHTENRLSGGFFVLCAVMRQSCGNIWHGTWQDRCNEKIRIAKKSALMQDTQFVEKPTVNQNKSFEPTFVMGFPRRTSDHGAAHGAVKKLPQKLLLRDSHRYPDKLKS